MSIRDNVLRVQERLENACARAGRKPEEITVVAVSKTVTAKEVIEAKDCGLTHFAENRVQKLLEKQETEELKYPKVDWHLIGHLQTNKVKYIMDKVSLIHSMDSIHLAEEINRQAEKNNMIMPVLLEMNISGEESKYGLAPELLDDFMEKFVDFKNLKLKGFMTMAPLASDEKMQHEIFAKIHNIYVDMAKQTIYNVDISTLSMGMSMDFESAVEEGSTMVRIGTDIFKAI